MKRALAALAIAAAAAACEAPSPPSAAPSPIRPQRIVSLDYCADQFVLKLADRTQIAAVSVDATRHFSYMRAEAHGLRQVRSTAEDVLAAKPDLVVRAYGGGPNVAHVMGRAGAPVAQLGFAEDFDGVRANIRAMALAIGHPERGEALIADMDARLRAIETPRSEVRALYLTPSGYTTGAGSMVDRMISAAGLTNFERQPGWQPIPLERIAVDKPDLIAAVDFGADTARLDAWSAARHPVARRRLATLPIVAMDGAWTACGGWFLVDAVEAMADARTRAEQRQ